MAYWIAVGSCRIGAARSVSLERPTALAAIVLGCLTLAGGYAAAESPAAIVTVTDGHLSARVGEAPLEAVLEALAAQTDLMIRIRGDPGTVSPQEFANLPLEAGIRRLIGERSLMMVFHHGHLQEVRVYSDLMSDKLGSGEPITRTLGSLAKGPPPVPEPPSYQELATKDKGERLAAIRDLARQKDDAALEVLGALLAHDPDRTVRRIAAAALSNIGGEAVVPALEVALADQDVEVRIYAMRGLHVINGEAAAAPLGELARGDPDPELRRQAVRLLASLRSDEAWSIIELATSDPDDPVRQAAEAALRRSRWLR